MHERKQGLVIYIPQWCEGHCGGTHKRCGSWALSRQTDYFMLHINWSYGKSRCYYAFSFWSRCNCFLLACKEGEIQWRQLDHYKPMKTSEAECNTDRSSSTHRQTDGSKSLLNDHLKRSQSFRVSQQRFSPSVDLQITFLFLYLNLKHALGHRWQLQPFWFVCLNGPKFSLTHLWKHKATRFFRA